MCKYCVFQHKIGQRCSKTAPKTTGYSKHPQCILDVNMDHDSDNTASVKNVNPFRAPSHPFEARKDQLKTICVLRGEEFQGE